MRQSVSVILAAGMALSLTACHNSDDLQKIEELTQLHQQDSITIANLQSKVLAMQSKAQAAVDAEEVTAVVNNQEGVPSGDIDTFNAQIDALTATINSSRDEVARLRSQLSSSNGQNSTLRKQVETLEKSIATKEAAIKSLRAAAEQDKSQIASLTLAVQELSEQAASNVSQIRELVAQAATATKEANRAYYIVGTQDQLEAKGIIEKAKGITRARVWTGKTDPSLYTEVDKRTFTGLTLKVGKVKDVKFITSQSPDTYTLTPDGTFTDFRIQDTDAFWASGRYVVIVLSASL